jgi:hypothetical protein
LKKQQALLVDELCQAHHPLQFVGCSSPTRSLVPSQELISQTALMIMDPITSHTLLRQTCTSWFPLMQEKKKLLYKAAAQITEPKWLNTFGSIAHIHLQGY